jgi:hypothetical protein
MGGMVIGCGASNLTTRLSNLSAAPRPSRRATEPGGRDNGHRSRDKAVSLPVVRRAPALVVGHGSSNLLRKPRVEPPLSRYARTGKNFYVIL